MGTLSLTLSRATRAELLDAIATGVWPTVAAWINGARPECARCADLWTRERRRLAGVVGRGPGPVVAMMRLDGAALRVLPARDDAPHHDGAAVRAADSCDVPAGRALVGALPLGRCNCGLYLLRSRRDSRAPQCATCRRARSAARRVTPERARAYRTHPKRKRRSR